MTTPKQAVILAGGLGTRLKPYTDNLPKPMIDINGIPFLSHLFNYLKKNDISRVLLLTGYKSEKIVDFYGDGTSEGIEIEYSFGEVNWKTGKRLKHAEKKLDEQFLLLYCDNYCPIILDDLFAFNNEDANSASVVVYNNLDSCTMNNMLVSDNNLVITYDKSRQSKNLNGVEIGFFVLQKRMIVNLPEGNYPFEKILLPDLIQKKALRAFTTNHKYYSIGSVDRLKYTKRFLSERKVLFLDRDGVINEKAPKAQYVNSWSEFKFLSGSINAIKNFSDNNFEIYIITNQAGIQRGKTSLRSLDKIHENLTKKFSEENIKIHGIYFCPHGWDEGCWCRKPKPGMLFQASYDHCINLTESFMIGDDERDVLAGENANCKKSFLFTSSQSLSDIADKIM